MFDVDTIADHQERFVKGRLTPWKPKQPVSDFRLEEVNCQASLDLGEDDTSFDDEILAEILREEQEAAA